jgi:hypothetical protein
MLSSMFPIQAIFAGSNRGRLVAEQRFERDRLTNVAIMVPSLGATA